MNRVCYLSLFVTLLIVQTASAANITLTAVHTFACTGNQSNGPCPQGGEPISLIQGSDGDFYGLANVSTLNSPQTGGVVFSVTPAGEFSVLHTFTAGAGNNFSQGSNPTSLVEGRDGNLYGITSAGGAANGQGVLFRISKLGTGFKVIHKFCTDANCSDGASANNLVVGQDGNIYGSTVSGGSGICQGGCGTIFRVIPSTSTYGVVLNGSLNTIQFPKALTVAPDGTLVGFAGTTLFRYSPTTAVLSTHPEAFPLIPPIHFTAPVGQMTIGPDGDLYGLYFAYELAGHGIFKVAPDGSGLHVFPMYTTSATGPGALLLASDSNFWIPEETANGIGDIVTISPATGQVLKAITNFGLTSAAGIFPSSITQATDGTLWGTSLLDGIVPKTDSGAGVVFKLNAGLPPG